jgi:hypothetical protein
MNGSQKVLITDGGAHSPQKWALATADHLVHFAESSAPPDQIIAARKLELAIADALVAHHADVQLAERHRLAADAKAHLARPLDASLHLEDAVEAVVECAKGTPWEAHFAKPETQAAVSDLIHQHFRSAQHIERSWHCDRNPPATPSSGPAMSAA